MLLMRKTCSWAAAGEAANTTPNPINKVTAPLNLMASLQIIGDPEPIFLPPWISGVRVELVETGTPVRPSTRLF
jgi:hypothetical protein